LVETIVGALLFLNDASEIGLTVAKHHAGGRIIREVQDLFDSLFRRNAKAIKLSWYAEISTVF
jgi:hypothetical protein